MNNITGTIINYYFHCKIQCWLHANRINLEDNSEDVRIAKVLHEINEETSGSSEIFIFVYPLAQAPHLELKLYQYLPLLHLSQEQVYSQPDTP